MKIPKLYRAKNLVATAIFVSFVFGLPVSALLIEEMRAPTGAYMHPYLRHDVAVIDVEPSQAVVSQGDIIGVNVTVENQGDYTETFNVTAYYNNTVIKEKTVTDLAAGDETTITFNWDTTGVALGNYTISARAQAVPGETDLIDNIFTDGNVAVIGIPPGLFADLIKRQAWPEHRNYDISKDEDDYQTLHAEVKNLGNHTAWVKAVYNITKDDGFSTIIESGPTLVEIDETADLSADFGPLASADAGRYYVSATCWYSSNEMVWDQGEREKTFKFKITP